MQPSMYRPEVSRSAQSRSHTMAYTYRTRAQIPQLRARQSTNSARVKSPCIILVKQHKHLGVVFSNQLDWSAHMMHLLSMGKRKAGFLRFMARELPADLSSQNRTYSRSTFWFLELFRKPSLFSRFSPTFISV